MKLPWRFTLTAVTTDAVIMLALGITLFSLEPALTNPDTELAGYGVAIILTTCCLVPPCIRLLRLVHGVPKRRKLFQILLSQLLLACWVGLWILQSSPLDIRLLLLLCGLHGVLWGLWLLNLAVQVRMFVIKAALVSLMGAITSACGIIIAVQPSLDRLTALTLAASFTTFIGLAITSFELFLYRALEDHSTTSLTPEVIQDVNATLHTTASM